MLITIHKFVLLVGFHNFLWIQFMCLLPCPQYTLKAISFLSNNILTSSEHWNKFLNLESVNCFILEWNRSLCLMEKHQLSSKEHCKNVERKDLYMWRKSIVHHKNYCKIIWRSKFFKWLLRAVASVFTVLLHLSAWLKINT